MMSDEVKKRDKIQAKVRKSKQLNTQYIQNNYSQFTNADFVIHNLTKSFAINKQAKTEPLESLYITYSSATKIKLALEDAAQVRKVMQGIQSVHLQKQQSEALISNSKEPVLNVDNNNAANQLKNEEHKQSPQKGRFLVRNEYGNKMQSENKISHSSVAPNKYHKNQSSFGEGGKKIRAEDIWKRRKDYDQKVRQFHLPKIKEYNRFQNNSLQKQQSGQQTAEIQFSDVFKDDLDDDLLQEYNEKYYKNNSFFGTKIEII